MENGRGIIFCQVCRKEYPIIKDIPRLLSGKLLENCYFFYFEEINKDARLKEFFQKSIFDQKIPDDKILKTKSDTQKQFGYEWHIWKKLPEFAENHFLEVMEQSESFFRGKFGWDPAIGMGRDLYNAAKAVGDQGLMIGSDLSFAVDMAYERCRDMKNILIVQADLYSNFLAPESLDFAYMIGLIQHLTEPQRGIEQVYGKIKNTGYFVGTIYTKPKDILGKILVAAIYSARIFTLHLPLPLVLFVSRVYALPAYIFFKLPSFILNRFAYVRKMNELYPTHETQKRGPNMDLLAHNWFDHFTPPVIGFYSDDEIMKMLKNIKLNDFKLNCGIFSGFKKTNNREEADDLSVISMSQNFKENMAKLSGYSERMKFSEEYYKKWYQKINSSFQNEQFTVGSPINHDRIIKLFDPASRKSIFLFSPSLCEINLFSRYFLKVYFLAMPYIDGKLPENAIQLKYDENYQVAGSDISPGEPFCDYAFSHHVVEHIHPDDINDHLKLVGSFIKKGGEYLIICPSKTRILKDENSGDSEKKIAANHHIGRYDYGQLAMKGKKNGFRKAYCPIINPYLYNFWTRYRLCPTDMLAERVYNLVPDKVLSFLGLNTLYIKLKK